MAELPNIKPGDRVRAEFEAGRVTGSGVWAVGPSDEPSEFVRFEHITEVIPAPKTIKVGDRMKWGGHPTYVWEVIHILDGSVWVRGFAADQIAKLSDLTLIEDA